MSLVVTDLVMWPQTDVGSHFDKDTFNFVENIMTRTLMKYQQKQSWRRSL